MKRLLLSYVHPILIIRNAAGFSQRRSLSSMLGGVTAECPAAFALISCCASAVIGFPAHLLREYRLTLGTNKQ